MYYRKYEDRSRQWRWTFYASNGEEIGVSSESYVSEADCDRSIALMKASYSAPVRRG
jgi:uncharacterized protein YegP (UPF0339 family)